jgi:hypothetical protein
MRDLITILFLILLVSCRNNPKLPNSMMVSSTGKGVTNQSNEKDSSSKTIKTNEISNYPHKLDTTNLGEYLNDPKIDSTVLSYCRGTFKTSDNDKTIEFLKLISKKSDRYFPIYFQVFNNICENSDGAESELLGDYCFKFVINYPNEVLKHFATNNYDLYLYSMFLGAEFYFKSEGTSDLMMDFSMFKKYLSEKMNPNDTVIKNISSIFYAKIDSFMMVMK